MEYGLALGCFNDLALAPLAAIQNKFITNISAWRAVNLATALFGLPSIPRRAQELAARFLIHCRRMNTDVLAFHTVQLPPPPSSCLEALNQNALIQNLPPPPFTIAELSKRWGQEEREVLARSIQGIHFLPKDRRPDVSVTAVLPKTWSNALIAWRIGAMTTPHRLCASTGRRLTRKHASACSSAAIYISLRLSFEIPDESTHPFGSAIDFVFSKSLKRTWTADCEELRVVMPLLLEIQRRCLGIDD